TKGTDVKVLSNQLAVGTSGIKLGILSGHQIGIIGAKANQRCIHAAHHGERIASLNRRDAIELPSIDKKARKAGEPIEARRLPEIGNYKTMIHVVLREPFIGSRVKWILGPLPPAWPQEKTSRYLDQT